MHGVSKECHAATHPEDYNLDDGGDGECCQRNPDGADAFFVGNKGIFDHTRIVLVTMTVKMEDCADDAPHAMPMLVVVIMSFVIMSFVIMSFVIVRFMIVRFMIMLTVRMFVVIMFRMVVVIMGMGMGVRMVMRLVGQGIGHAKFTPL